MLFINRLKSYHFSLEEIKEILDSNELLDELLYTKLLGKKQELEEKVQHFEPTLNQLGDDLTILENGKSIMSYLEHIDVQLVEVPTMYLLSIRKMVQKWEFSPGLCLKTVLKGSYSGLVSVYTKQME